jgi:hypothetical protein
MGKVINTSTMQKSNPKAAMTEFLFPWYARTTCVLLGISLAFAILFVGRDIFVPLSFAALLSVLLYPLSSFLERHKVPRILSIFIAVAIACAVSICLVTAIAMQIGQFGGDIPRLKEEGTEYVNLRRLTCRRIACRSIAVRAASLCIHKRNTLPAFRVPSVGPSIMERSSIEYSSLNC